MSTKRKRVQRVDVRHPVSLLGCLSLLARLSPFSLTLCAWLAGGWVWLAASTHSPWVGPADRAQAQAQCDSVERCDHVMQTLRGCRPKLKGLRASDRRGDRHTALKAAMARVRFQSSSARLRGLQKAISRGYGLCVRP